jgi:non-ribosomal peptide synthetase-like protein
MLRKALYPGSRPAEPRTLVDILRATAATHPSAVAIDDGRRTVSYHELLDEVRAFGRQVAAEGIGWGDRVGVRIPSGTVELYTAILTVLSLGAAYVPVDLDDPDERAELVWTEAGVCAVIGTGGRVTRRAASPRGAGAHPPRPSDDAWIIFTSGSTGTPKGVAVTHRSAAAFVDAEAELFLRDRPLGVQDRVLAGLSVAFDASCEEMWLAWRYGACLVPAPRALVRDGAELGDWLLDRDISVVSTVPTLAALWTPAQLRGVRLLILGGEACPEHLAARLAAVCPEVWNTYGPTETTVVACAARLTVDGPVRIGLPLDGWRLAVVDPRGRLVSWGEIGELVIAGVGTGRYLDPAKDAAKFTSLPSLGWQRAYRSGDLVRAEPAGLSYIGRIDSQVKIRGYRIELTEIESVLSRAPGIAQAAVSTHEATPGAVELVGYYLAEPGADVDQRTVLDHLRTQLPAHMVPAYLQQLDFLPISTSGKLDRNSLPPPAARCALDAGPCVEPADEVEAVLAEALAEVLDLPRVSVESHFFDDLGANSLLLAHFCARARERAQLPGLAMEDVYRHPTVRTLARAVAGAVVADGAVTARYATGTSGSRRARVGTAGYLLCGALQVLLGGAMAMLAAVVVVWGGRLIWPATGFVDLYLTSALVTSVVFAALCVLPIMAKWILVGRWRERQIRIWSLGYVRFWLVKTLIRSSPLALFSGSPLYLMYLRALGAKIGRGVAVFAGTVPVCTDLLTIGANTVIRKGCSFTGYRAVDGVIQTGPVTIGADVVVGDSAVLDIGTAIGAGGQLGHASYLHSGQTVPAGQRWHGSPAQPTDVDYRVPSTSGCGQLRRALFATMQVANVVLGVPLPTAAGFWLAHRLDGPIQLVGLGPLALGQGSFYLTALVASAVLFFGGSVVGLALVVTVPRVLRSLVAPGRSHPLYGFAYWVHRVIARMTSTPFFINLFGDSSYIVGYLRALGYRIAATGQTGSNFGAALSHESPYLVSIGTGTMVSDGVGFLNASYSHASFHTSHVSLGAQSFLGNAIVVPEGGRLGANCLVGTKTMIPVDGPVRENVGLLGSPPFEIPRTTCRDNRLGLNRTRFKQRLAAKNAHNLRTMGLHLLVEWLRLYLSMVVGAATTLALFRSLGPAALALAGVLVTCVNLGYSVLVERASTSFRDLRPRDCSIYDGYFWRHERFWKLSTQPTILNGTPFKALFWRLLGARVGRRVFDDGCSISEKTLVSIGDDVTLNAGTILQSHSMEDGVFKSDRIVIGAGASLGSGAFVHYGVTVGARSRLDADVFLMKGEQVPESSHWRGNPARQIGSSTARSTG